MSGTRMQQRRGDAADWTSLNYVLGDGEWGLEKDTGLTKVGDGTTAWNSLPYSSMRALFNAAGDIIVATGAHSAARLPKGTNGQYLTMAAGAVSWQTPPSTDLSSTVALDGSRTMTGNQLIDKTDPKFMLRDDVNDRIQIVADTGIQYIQVDDELHICSIDGTISSPKGVRAGALYDTGNRVYSLSNPPPGVSAVPVLGYNTHVWTPDPSDHLPLSGATYSSCGGYRVATQAATAGAIAIPALALGVPRKGFDQTAIGTVILEGVIVRSSTSAASNLVGLSVTSRANDNAQFESLLFDIDGANGNVSAYSYTTGSATVFSNVPVAGIQRGSTQAAAASVGAPLAFKITATSAGIVTFALAGTNIFSGSISIDLTNPDGALALLANQCRSGSITNVGTGHFCVTYS